MKSIIVFLFLCHFSLLPAQEIIKLRNPSFEIPVPTDGDLHPCCKAPRGWFACGSAGSNTPDVQPGHFNVETPAIDGNYYLGMVVRDDETWESISQRLSSPLLADKSYSFSIALANSGMMGSTDELQDFFRPATFRIWGGDGYCARKELLAKSKQILNSAWEYYDFVLQPKAEYQYITLEVFYKIPSPIPYNGNLLLDDCSDIVELDD